MQAYIQRMEQEFKETHERYTKGKAYLDKKNKENQPKENAIGESIGNCVAIDNPELEMLRSQLWSMGEYLKTLGARIMFAKAKEGEL